MTAFTVRIGSLDPGQTTGLAIADVHVTPEKVILVQVKLGSYPNAHGAAREIIRRDCSSVVIERMPENASLLGREPYEAAVSMLAIELFEIQKSFVFQTGALILISPGLWKPVMKAQHITEHGSWEPRTQHEKDALALLHYVVKLNHMSREVVYK